MTRNLKYIYSVMLHKWYVLIESFKLKIPWRGLMHDVSKFSMNEWGPRVKSESLCKKDEQGKITVSDELAISWIHHYHNNPHHWQWWVTMLDDGTVKVLPMTDVYRREMLADWRAVSRMPNRMELIPWYIQNQSRIILHPDTRKWLETQIGV